MKKIWNWILNNPNRAMFLVPILLVAAISISHVVTWYEMANPINWAIYLSIAIEVGAMTALVAATNKIRGGVWFMFGLVTFIQMVGNIFYSYYQIDETGKLFQSWIELTAPIWEMAGTETTDIVGMKRWLAFLEGGLLPLISLTSLHFFVTYEKEDEAKEEVKKKSSLEQDVVKIIEANENPPEPNEKLKEAKKSFDEETKTVEEVSQIEEVEELVDEDFLESLEAESYEDIVNEKIEEEMKEEPVEIQKDEEFDESHALDMVLNDMVDDLMEDEGVETVEELIEVLEDETIVEEIAEEETKDEEDTPKSITDVTINNKPPKRKMGIDRIR
jgi:hypothetical protein